MTPDALALPIEGDRFRLERESDTSLAVFRKNDGERVGTLTVEWQGDALAVRSLFIDEAHRSYGAGSEAALLFNRACDAGAIPLVRTWAPPGRGLSVYFWIRMGFRPLHGEGPEGGLWFERRR